MPAKRKHADAIPESFSSPEDAGRFWDTHDLGDYWNETEPVDDVVFALKRRHYLVSLEPSLSNRLSEVATQRGVAGETLVNLWLKEKLDTLAPKAPPGPSIKPRLSGRRVIEME